MRSQPSPADVVVGLLTENTTRMVAQAVRLLRSIRWFGGTLAQSRTVVCTVGELAAGAQRQLRDLGAELRVVSRFHPANPTGNRHQLIAELLDAPEPLLFLLDCDTLVVQDPLPHLELENFQAKIAPGPTVSDEVFERLFAHFGIPKPARTHRTGLCGTPTVPYFNGGVLAIPRALAGRLAPTWRRYNLLFTDRPELVAPCELHMHQAALTLALAEEQIPCRELEPALNFQTNAAHLFNPAAYVETDPVIIHYHHLASDDGYLLPCAYPKAQARIDSFHERLREHGIERGGDRAVASGSERPVLILGMHRSGTSLLAQFVGSFGIATGEPDRLPAGDMFNPTGYWEYSPVVDLDREILGLLGQSAMDCASVDTGAIAEEAKQRLLARAREATASLRKKGPYLLKDPRISLLFPFWREALGDPLCIIVWRHPMAVARSLERRDRFPAVLSLAIWEHYNRTILRETQGVPRMLVSYEELVARPDAIAGELHAWLSAQGLSGLRHPDHEAIRQIVLGDFNRSGREEEDESLLDGDQAALLAALRDGSALRVPVVATSPRALGIIEAFGRMKRREDADHDQRVQLHGQLAQLHGQLVQAPGQLAQLHSQLAQAQGRINRLEESVRMRDELLGAVFASRSWKVGHALSALLRRVTGSDAIAGPAQWERMKRESGE